MGNKGGCALLVKAMREHYIDEGICEMDMVLLDSLTAVPENGKNLLEEDLQTVDLAKWILDTYPQNETLIEAGQRLLRYCQLSTS